MHAITGFFRPLAGLFLLLLPGLGGCGQEQAPVLKIGTNVWPGYEPLYLARKLGQLPDDRVRLVEYSSASQVIRGYQEGMIDAGALTLDEVLLLQSRGYQPCVALVMDISDGADVMVAKPEITGIKQLKGQRVGVENTALGAYTLSRALELGGLTPADIKIVPMEVDEHEQSYVQGQVDAVVTFEPVRSKLLAAGAQVIFDSSQIPDEIVDVLAVRREYVEQHPEQLSYLLDKWFETLAYMREQPNEAAKILGQRLKLGVEETLASYDGLKLPMREQNQQLLGKKNARGLTQVHAIAEKLAKVMIRQGLLTTDLNVAELCVYHP